MLLDVIVLRGSGEGLSTGPSFTGNGPSPLGLAPPPLVKAVVAAFLVGLDGRGVGPRLVRLLVWALPEANERTASRPIRQIGRGEGT
jgi:hypothetical protein